MARNTQGNIIIKGSFVFPVNVSPLNKTWSIIFFSTLRTFGRFPLFSSDPLMKSSIANTFSFPSIVIGIRQLFYCTDPIWHFGSSFWKFVAKFYQFFISSFRITTSGTKISRLDFRRRSKHDCFAFDTFNFDHCSIIATI